ncbi:hypothetical protein AURDEDRAFT_177419 [Auricularia subglabra TFB-10046 SS5]|uniref:Uncharacterized protein n=1 Tax=Auricularia subglabra (strain TFB-10046 / SS5) TaxID=717982 RepID=J0D475_AURST|nr:hypothetical protein AURDEDRAFT_177419 [Auricularia subglabra TFB-10046 SS5]
MRDLRFSPLEALRDAARPSARSSPYVLAVCCVGCALLIDSLGLCSPPLTLACHCAFHAASQAPAIVCTGCIGAHCRWRLKFERGYRRGERPCHCLSLRAICRSCKYEHGQLNCPSEPRIRAHREFAVCASWMPSHVARRPLRAGAQAQARHAEGLAEW